LRCAEATRRLAVAGILAAASATASAAVPKAEILGVWRGESICVKSPEFPACRDESVEYDVYDAAGGAVHLSAYKFVGGEKVLMGEMDFAYDEKAGSWTSEFQSPRYHGLWTFTVAGGTLTGTLVDLPSKHRVRDILVRRDQSSAK
jgi:hypothetical protein